MSIKPCSRYPQPLIYRPHQALNSHDRIYILPISFAVAPLLTFLIYSYAKKTRIPKSNHNGTKTSEKPSNPQSSYLITPLTLPQITSLPNRRTPPKPYPTFSITTAKPRPYRPFRWPYHQTMALTRLEPDWWLELESTYSTRFLQRAEIYKKYETKIIVKFLGIDDPWKVEVACREVMEMVVQFLCARYPQYFPFDPQNYIFSNEILDREFEIYNMDPL